MLCYTTSAERNIVTLEVSMYISKKELLQLTGISYGQLYRWKREGLIPESWFIKQSSYTGQETFFPKDKIVDRVKAIQDMKDKYSLDELARLLSPEASSDVFIMEEQIPNIVGLNIAIYDKYKQLVGIDELRFYDFLLVLAFSNIQRQLHLENERLFLLLENIAIRAKQIGSVDCVLLVLEVNEQLYSMILKENEYMERKQKEIELFFDQRFTIRFALSLSEVNEQFRRENKNLF